MIMSMEKLVAIWFPLGAIGWFTRRRMRWVLIAVTVFLIVWSAPQLFRKKVDYLRWICPYANPRLTSFKFFTMLVMQPSLPIVITSVSTTGSLSLCPTRSAKIKGVAKS